MKKQVLLWLVEIVSRAIDHAHVAASSRDRLITMPDYPPLIELLRLVRLLK